jgi:hypothetical protein
MRCKQTEVAATLEMSQCLLPSQRKGNDDVGALAFGVRSRSLKVRYLQQVGS